MSASPPTKLAEPPDEGDPMLPTDALAGEVALVTGGGSGLGFGMAEGMGHCGATVALVGRSLGRLEEGAARLRKQGIRVVLATADVREPEQVAAAFDVVEHEAGPVTILANNAGGNFPVLSHLMSPNAWRAVVRIAYDGVFFCSTEFYRRRLARGGGGAIVNNGAHYALTAFPCDAHSASAKAAVVNLTRTLAVEWAADGIRVNAIAAGFFPHNASVTAKPEEADARLAPHVPAGRPGRMRELGWMAAYLCSPYAAYVTGLVLTMDGADSLAKGPIPPLFTPPRERGEVLW